MTKSLWGRKNALLAATALAACLMAGTISPATAQAVYEFDVPRGDLASVVTAIARTSGTVIAFPADLGDGVVAGPIQGREPVRSALERALAGSGLEIFYSGNNLTVRRAAESSAVEGDVETINLTGLIGSGSHGDQGFQQGDAGNTVRLGDAPIKEIPISVSAVTNEAMRSQVLTTTTDAVRNVAGVTQTRNSPSGRPAFSIRGFRDGGYRVDGVSAGPQARVPIDNVDRVEVLKGPTSILTGVATEGGLVNVVRKRPTGERIADITTRFGDHFYKTLAFDFGDMVPDSDTWAYRFVGSVNHANETEGGYSDPRELLIAPSLKYTTDHFDITTAIEYTKQRHAKVPYAYLHQYFVPGGEEAVELRRIPKGVFGNDRFGEATENLSFHNEINYDAGTFLGFDVSFNSTLDYSDAKTTVNEVGLFSPFMPGPSIAYATTYFSTDTQILAFKPSVTLKREFGDIKSTTKIGYDYQRNKGTTISGSQDLSLDKITTFPFGGDLDFYDGPLETQAASSEVSGLYAVQKVDLLSDRLHLLGSLRRDDETVETAGFDASTHSGTSYVIGAAFDVTDDLSTYVNYSDGMVPGSIYQGRPIEPEGRTLKEVGLRYSMFDDWFDVGVSLYELTRSNVTIIGLTGIPDDPNAPFNKVQGLQTRGLEFEAKGELRPAWNLTGSFTYLDAKNLSENNEEAPPYNALAGNPRYTASLWTTYMLQDAPFDGVTLGFGARGISDSEVNIGSDFSGRTSRLPGYLVADALIGYEKDNFSAELKINNLFDKEALQPANSGEYIGIERRSWIVSVRYRF